jgi:hypothetical protein
MTVAIGLGLLLALGGATFSSVHRRRVRTRTVRRVRASLARLTLPDPAAPLRPTVTAKGAAVGTTPQGPGATPDLLVPAARRQHFVLTADEIEHHRRVS